MKTIHQLRNLMAGALLTVSIAAAQNTSDIKEVTLSATDTLKFNITRIEVAPGQKIHVQLRNDSSMPKAVMAHNWVLLKAGQDANRYSTAAVSSAAEGYQPKSMSDDVIASIAPLGPHETGDVTFTAPTTPGRYEYLCSYPAHCAAGMRGELIVK